MDNSGVMHFLVKEKAMKVRRSGWLGVLAGLFLCAAYGVRAFAADSDEPTAKKAGDSEQVVVEQSAIADKFKNLEKSIDRLASDMEAKDKRRADLLRQAFKVSKDKNITGHLDELVGLLQKDQLSKAAKGQSEVQKDLL